MSNKIIPVSILLIIAFVSITIAGDWPSWRGPAYNGSADESNLPDSWSPSWSAPLPGEGFSTPIVSNGKIFLTSQEKNTDNYLAICIDETTGKELWKKTIGSDPRQNPRNNMSTPSPVTDGKTVFFLYGNGDLVAADFEGNIKWQRDLEEKFDILTLKYGYSSSPLLYGGKLYILVLRRDRGYREPMNKTLNDSFLLAVDPENGKDIFKHARKTNAQDESLDAYSSIIPFDNKGRAELLIIGADYVTSHDPATGTEYWRYEYALEKSTRWRHIPSVVTGNGMVFGVRSRGSGMFAIAPIGNGNITDTATIWNFDGPTPDSPTPLYYKGNIYVMSGRQKTITCLDPGTGRQKAQVKLDARSTIYASPTAADEKIYCISENGRFFVLDADPDNFNVISSFETGEKPAISSIAVANSRIFVRTAKKLYCIAK